MNTESPWSICSEYQGWLSVCSPPALPPVHPRWPASAPPRTEARQCYLVWKENKIKSDVITREVQRVQSKNVITYLPAVPRLASWKLMPCLREEQRSTRKLWTSSRTTDNPAPFSTVLEIKKYIYLTHELSEEPLFYLHRRNTKNSLCYHQWSRPQSHSTYTETQCWPTQPVWKNALSVFYLWLCSVQPAERQATTHVSVRSLHWVLNGVCELL